MTENERSPRKDVVDVLVSVDVAARSAPEPLFIKIGEPPTALNARTGEFTPPANHVLCARERRDRSFEVHTVNRRSWPNRPAVLTFAKLASTDQRTRNRASKACIAPSSPRARQPTLQDRRAIVQRGERFETAVVLGNDGFVAVRHACNSSRQRRGDQGRIAGDCENALRLCSVGRRKKAAERSAAGPAIDDIGQSSSASSGPEKVSRSGNITGATREDDRRRAPRAARRRTVFEFPGKARGSASG